MKCQAYNKRTSFLKPFSLLKQVLALWICDNLFHFTPSSISPFSTLLPYLIIFSHVFLGLPPLCFFLHLFPLNLLISHPAMPSNFLHRYPPPTVFLSFSIIHYLTISLSLFLSHSHFLQLLHAYYLSFTYKSYHFSHNPHTTFPSVLLILFYLVPELLHTSSYLC